MKPQPEPSSREVLAGLVERVTYHNDGNGYCVLRIKARGHRELVTVVCIENLNPSVAVMKSAQKGV